MIKILCIQCLLYCIGFSLPSILFMKVVDAIPQINRTNIYYERHLEHINSI